MLPFRLHEPREAIIPWDGRQLLAGDDDRLDLFPGLAEWWRQSERAWREHRSNERLDLRGRLDYQRGTSDQFPIPAHRVVYTKGGMYMAAAKLDDPRAVVDHKLYWATVTSPDEADYLVAILNSSTLTRRVAPFQARGEHNPRDFDKYIFQVPIPQYDPDNDGHIELVRLARQAESIVTELELAAVSFQAQRRQVRRHLEQTGVAAPIEETVESILPQ